MRRSTSIFSLVISAFVVALGLGVVAQEPGALQKAFVATAWLSASIALACLTARPLLALVTSALTLTFIKALALLKEAYWQASLMPSDFYYFAGHNLDVLRLYPHFVVALSTAAATAALVTWSAVTADARYTRSVCSRWRVATRLQMGGAFAVLCVATVCLRGPFEPLQQKGLWARLSDTAHLTNFLLNARAMRVTLPPMARDLVARDGWAQEPQSEADAAAPYPDIVEVLEESTFDPLTFSACTIPQCHADMFLPDARTLSHGLLRTHLFGGGTWCSEFTVHTGMPHDIFGPSGSYAPMALAPRTQTTLPKWLKSLGYVTAAIFPVEGTFMGARGAYAAYGFDHFYDAPDLHLRAWLTPDAELFRAAKRVYDDLRRTGKPVFLFVMTAAQHGPHTRVPMEALPAPYNSNLMRHLPAEQALNWSNYLARLHASGEGLRELESLFLGRPEPTVLAWFGDHLASFGGLLRQMERQLPAGMEPYEQYTTNYMIKSNTGGPNLDTYPLLDIAYFPSMILDAARVPHGPYFEALRRLRRRCDGMYQECAEPGLLQSYHAWTLGTLKVFI
ncbi:MAG TPA: LTA synthase family protein [Myxococcota bacterium]|nr:LTA synthase family protein [Myxococcota bacterium]